MYLQKYNEISYKVGRDVFHDRKAYHITLIPDTARKQDKTYEIIVSKLYSHLRIRALRKRSKEMSPPDIPR